MNSESDDDIQSWRHRLFWKLQLGGWGSTVMLATVISGAGYLQTHDAVVIGVFRAIFGFTATCGLRLIYQGMRRHPARIWIRAVIILALCAALALVDSSATGFVSQLFGIETEPDTFRQLLTTSIIMRWMMYWLWSLLYFGINFWLDTQYASLRQARSEAEARASELKMLRAQVNPHFLFNALNSIQASATDAALVRTLTQALADYLRFSLNQHGDLQPLGIELDALDNYLQVEKIRFEEKLEYRIAAEPEAKQVLAPIALVQPLLENAIKYGQRTSRRPLRIRVDAHRQGEDLLLEVVNSGAWIESAKGESTGIGLANLRRRLQLLYEDRGRLSVEKREHEVAVSVRLPAATAAVP